MNPIPRERLPMETVAQARFLLGRLVVRVLPDGVACGRIVETEAYPPGDAAMHAYRGMTRRNRTLFLPHGHAYIYLCYGTAMMLNVSSEAEGVGAGVLIRALEPVAGIPLMAARRGGARLRDLARGPGRLAAALAIDLSLDGTDLCAAGPLFLSDDKGGEGGGDAAERAGAGVADREVVVSTRIGITRDAHRPLRFSVRGSPFVSGPARGNV